MGSNTKANVEIGDEMGKSVAKFREGNTLQFYKDVPCNSNQERKPATSLSPFKYNIFMWKLTRSETTV